MVTSPNEKRSPKPADWSAGNNKAPSATMVTPEAPVRAVKTAQAKKATIANPLGIIPKTLWKTATNLCEVPAALKTYPLKVNSGRATNKGVSTIR